MQPKPHSKRRRKHRNRLTTLTAAFVGCLVLLSFTTVSHGLKRAIHAIKARFRGSRTHNAGAYSPATLLQQQSTPQAGKCWEFKNIGAAAATVAVNNSIHVTNMNGAMADFGRNWLWWARAAGLTNIIIGAQDDEAAKIALLANVPCVNLTSYVAVPVGSTVDGSYFDWGQPGWKKMVWAKAAVCSEVMRAGFDVFWSDADAIWFQNPFPLLEKHPEVDLIMGTDHLDTALEEGDSGFEQPEQVIFAHWNTGAMVLRRGVTMQMMLDEWARGAHSNVTEVTGQGIMHDQDYLNWVLLRRGVIGERALQPLSAGGGHIAAPLWPRVILVYSKLLRVGIMPISRFMHGRSYSMQHLNKALKVDPMVLHMVWTLEGREGKRARYRENLLWYGDTSDSSYLSDGRFLSIDIAWPKVPYDNRSRPFGQWQEQHAMEAWHLAAMDYQLSQLYYGVAVATALNRTLILPRLSCFCDSAWVVASCRATTGRPTDFPLPYSCPWDLIFKAQGFSDAPHNFGSPVDYRFHSFLDEPALDQHIKASQAVLRAEGFCSGASCQEAAAKPCRAMPRVGQAKDRRQLHQGKTLPTYCIAGGIPGERLAAATAGLSAIRVLHLADGHRLWGAFFDAHRQKQLDLRAMQLVTSWTARDTHPDKVNFTIPAGRMPVEPLQIAPFKRKGLFEDVISGKTPMTDLLQERVMHGVDRGQLSILNWKVDSGVYHFKNGHDGQATLEQFDALAAS